MNIENEGGEEGRLLERGQKASDSEGKQKESYEIGEKWGKNQANDRKIQKWGRRKGRSTMN